VRIVEGNPHTIYRQYCESNPTFGGIAESLRQLGFKIAGGRLGETFEDIFQDGVTAFEQLMDYLDKQLDEIETLTPELVALMRKEKMRYIDEFNALSKTSNETMSKHIVDERTWSGIREFRQHFKIEPHHFNAIKPPNVLEQIWEVLCKSKVMPNSHASIDDFFMFNQVEIVSGMPFHRHQKVLSGYNMLNTIGYYPDKPLYNERGFKRATSDQTHASLASFCGCLITADERLSKKAEAIYEYLKVPTQVLYFDQVV
jgi:hypothetical protein